MKHRAYQKYYHMHRLKRIKESFSHLDIAFDEALGIYKASSNGIIIYSTDCSKKMHLIISELSEANINYQRKSNDKVF